ncbi:MAG: alpha/beta fold hydrolase [Candidatus Hydrogenedentes bacterium]|nr:alpha/beta fold hydrolase [Candidatus Hydrogenedentota bacterium]
MPLTFDRDSLKFHFRDEGTGVPFVYQHGLGADVSQPFSFFVGGHRGIRLISMDCRAHGQTRPLGPEDKLNIGALADDVVALMDFRKVEQAVVGGISMGAAIAMNIVLRYADRVRALVLQRPAWLGQPMPANLRVLVLIGELIREHGAQRGKEVFRATPEYAALQKESPDTAASNLAQFDHPRADETAIKLIRIPNDAPCADRAWKAIKVPTLVLANRVDPVHPYAFGETLAKEIPGAKFAEVTSKSLSIERHTADVRARIEDFLLALP